MDIFDRNPEFIRRLELLFKGNVHDHSKVLKIMQYSSVIISEFDLYKKFCRGYGLPVMLDGLIGGDILTKDKEIDLK